MTVYEPELGQAIFGQPHQEFKVPQIMDAALEFLASELDRVMGNIHQKDYESPFRNTGAQFECDTFKVHAYSWGNDEQEFNFAWRDLRISWYKYLGRGMSANKEIAPELAAEMLAECIEACRKHEAENDPFNEDRA